MFLTHREAKIIEYLIAYRNGVQLETLENVLQVSRRTVYREVASLEETLKPLNIQIVKPRGVGYKLVATEEQIDELKQEIDQSIQPTFDIQERQRAIALQLLLAEQPITMENLANELAVSVNTIQNDLSVIEMSLSDFGMTTHRIPATGIQITGSEKERRQIAGGLIYGNVTELVFFRYLNTLNEDNMMSSSNYFLQMISPESLLIAYQAFNESANQAFQQVNDNQMQQVITILALSIDRMQMGHWIKEAIPARDISNPSLKQAHSLIGQVSNSMGISIDLNERHFLARQLDGLNFKREQTIFIEDFDVQLSYKVKELIRLTTIYSRNDFRQDERLFYDLVAHLSAALKRPTSMLETINITVLDTVIEEYQPLYEGVKKAFHEVFGQINLAKDELAYILIHFATSYERQPRSKEEIRLLIICTSGIGTSRILENRIHKYIPEVTQTVLARASQLDQIDYSQYEMIVSTVYIPDFPQNYRVISPLLLEDDIAMIRDEIKQLIPSTPSDSSTLSLKQSPTIESVNPEEFSDLYAQVQTAHHLLQQFEVTTVRSETTMEQTIVSVLNTLDVTVLKDIQGVADYVIQRYLMAPIGIPETSMALFHSANTWVNKPVFQIFDLDRSFSIPGMNGEAIELERILLLLAPNPIDEPTERLLGIISSSIIENDINIETYNYGTQSEIHQLLSTLFVNEIRNRE